MDKNYSDRTVHIFLRTMIGDQGLKFLEEDTHFTFLLDYQST
jgi:hypothetical protein